MQADPAAQALLVRVSDLDQQIRSAEARKKTLPQHEALARLNARRVALGEQVVATQTRISDAEAALARVDEDLENVKARLARDQQRLDDGTVNDQKGIWSLQSEIEHLRGRIGVLEDESLTHMQAIEDDQAELAAAGKDKDGVEAEMRTLLAERNAAVATADAEIADHQAERAGLAAQIPAELLALYAKIAERSGTGAVWLVRGRCSGCGLQLDATTLKRFGAAAPDEVLRCEECGRILVRGPESGV
jgi:predicted  nucleic acid-binding Zn-ribbon protein